jgi:hypothetical protein
MKGEGGKSIILPSPQSGRGVGGEGEYKNGMLAFAPAGRENLEAEQSAAVKFCKDVVSAVCGMMFNNGYRGLDL